MAARRCNGGEPANEGQGAVPLMNCPEHKFSDVSDFLRRVQDYPNIVWIYRGQADATWPLIPKAGRREYFRPQSDEDPRDGLASPDLRRYKIWRREARAYSQSIPEGDLECLAYAQHYGLATRLLDWSKNPLVALYFAAETDDETDGAVYCYLTWDAVVDGRANPQEIPRVARYVPRPFDRRILAQAAAFTIHPRPQDPLSPEKSHAELEQFAPDGVDLVRFIVRSQFKSAILRQLSEICVDRKHLFPDLEGLSGFINWQTRYLGGKMDRAEETGYSDGTTNQRRRATK